MTSLGPRREPRPPARQRVRSALFARAGTVDVCQDCADGRRWPPTTARSSPSFPESPGGARWWWRDRLAAIGFAYDAGSGNELTGAFSAAATSWAAWRPCWPCDSPASSPRSSSRHSSSSSRSRRLLRLPRQHVHGHQGPPDQLRLPVDRAFPADVLHLGGRAADRHGPLVPGCRRRARPRHAADDEAVDDERRGRSPEVAVARWTATSATASRPTQPQHPRARDARRCAADPVEDEPPPALARPQTPDSVGASARPRSTTPAPRAPRRSSRRAGSTSAAPPRRGGRRPRRSSAVVRPGARRDPPGAAATPARRVRAQPLRTATSRAGTLRRSPPPEPRRQARAERTAAGASAHRAASVRSGTSAQNVPGGRAPRTTNRTSRRRRTNGSSSTPGLTGAVSRGRGRRSRTESRSRRPAFGADSWEYDV